MKCCTLFTDIHYPTNFTDQLRRKNIRDWDKGELNEGMAAFQKIHNRIEQLKQRGEVITRERPPQARGQSQEETPNTGQKRKRGRPKGQKNRVQG